MNTFFDLKDKTALIVGGTSGIGLAVAKRFSEAGCHVFVAGRTNRLAESDGDIEFHRCDVTSEASVELLFSAVIKRAGKLNILLINAGIGAEDRGDFGKLDSAEFDQAMATNTRGAFLCLNQAPANLADGASVIITSTGAAYQVFPGYTTYGTSKSTLFIMAKHAAAQLGSRGIRVNCLSPGTIVTAMQPEDSVEAVVCETQTCLGRTGKTDDVIGAFHFLAADESRYITATELVVDGGWLGGMTRRSVDAIVKYRSGA